MTKIIVFTDIHIDVDPRPTAPNPQARFVEGIAHVMRHQSDADMVIVTGDLAHCGDEASYRKLKDLLAPLTLPTHLMIGNHDNRAAFLSVFPDTPTDDDGFVQQVIDLPNARLVLLDTLFAPPYDFPGSHAGHLCDKRLGWLERALTESGKPCIVFMHHLPHDVGFPAMDAIKLRDEDAFYDVIHRAGTVRQIICGHIHRTISGTHRGVPFAVFKSPVGQMPLDFESEDLHSEVDEPAAYGLLLVTPEAVLVHTEDFGLSTQT